MKKLFTVTMLAVSTIGLLTACGNEDMELYKKAKTAIEDRYENTKFQKFEICKTEDKDYLTVKATDAKATEKYIYIISKNETRMATSSPLFETEKSCKVLKN
ncbi:hypothetical protein P4H08_19220 [Bacillus cereus]|nr:hypothetical protein [Bacillus cereus]